MYYSGTYSGLETVSHRLCDAEVYDTKYFAVAIDGYELISVTKKELFEARLKGA